MQSDAALTLMWLIIATYFMVFFCINGDSKEKKDETTKQPRISLKKDTTSIVMQAQEEEISRLKTELHTTRQSYESSLGRLSTERTKSDNPLDLITIDDALGTSDEKATPVIITHELIEKIDALNSETSDMQGKIFILKFIKGKSNDEIMEELHLCKTSLFTYYDKIDALLEDTKYGRDIKEALIED